METKTAKSHESSLWKSVDGEWKKVFGSFSQMGLSVEWHDFDCENTLEWSRSFHPDSAEICLNLAGCGSVQSGKVRKLINPQTVSHYFVDNSRLSADRHPGQRHRFLTVEVSRDWLTRNAYGLEDGLALNTRKFLDGKKTTVDEKTETLHTRLQSAVEDLRHPPAASSALWFQAKALEIVSQTLFAPRPDELFCMRHKRMAEDRVSRVKALLSEDLENPPTLTEMGKQIGCSPFYLCRIFSQHIGVTISQYLRQLRMEEAAKLLQSGKHNVTETALIVGYSSLSHFSKAFSETFGTCPCAYPLKRRA